MTLPEMMEKLKKNWIASAVLCIVAGLILLFWPEQTLTAVCYVMGAVAIVMGVIRIVRYFKQDHTYPVIFQADLAVGFLALGLGIFMISNPKTVTSLIPVLFGVVILGFGAANILRSSDAKAAGVSSWKLMLVLALITVALGLAILIYPFSVLTITVSVAGGCLVYEGVTDILTVLLVGKRIEAWRSAK